MSSAEYSSATAQATISSLYETFFLLNGSFEDIVQTKGREALQRALLLFFSWYLSPAPASPPISGIRYLSLDSPRFMRLQSFLSHVAFSQLRYDPVDTILLYNEYLVSSTIPLKETKSLYSYIVQVLIPEAVCSEISTTPTQRSYWFKRRQVIFAPNRSQLSVFRTVNGGTLALIHQDSLDLDELTPLCSQEFYPLVTQMSANQSQADNLLNANDASISYVYLNASNCALKTSAASATNAALQAFEEDLPILTNSDESSTSSSALQLLAKNDEDLWLGVQRAEQRTLFCVLSNHKNASLAEAALALPFSGVFQ